MDRDALLAAALGTAVLAGCTRREHPSPLPSGSASPIPAAHPDAALLTSWALAERRAAGACAGALRAVPALAALRANHVARALAAEEALAARGGTPTPAPAVPPSKAAPAALLRDLAAYERRLVSQYATTLARATDAAVAVLGAELMAGARQHATLLPLVPVPKARP